MKNGLVNGNYQLMIFIENKEIVGASILEFNNFPNDRVLFIVAMGGKVSKEHINLMSEWAKSLGATCIRGISKESAARLWRMKHGFKTVSYLVEKRLWEVS